ncbi:MAG: hypothetical protein AAGD96_05525 [Chloroflexota bacterium]
MKNKVYDLLTAYNIHWADEQGQTLIEYALIFVGVAGLIIAGIVIYGEEISQMYNEVYNFFEQN